MQDIIRDQYGLICTTNDKGLDGGDTSSNEGFFRACLAMVNHRPAAQGLRARDLHRQLVDWRGEGRRHPMHGPQTDWGWNDPRRYSRDQELPIVMWIMIALAQYKHRFDYQPHSLWELDFLNEWQATVDIWCSDRARRWQYQNKDICVMERLWLHPRLTLRRTALVWIGDLALLIDALMVTRWGFQWDHDKPGWWKFRWMKPDHTSGDKIMVLSLCITKLFGPWSPLAWLAEYIYLHHRGHISAEDALRSYYRAESGNSPAIGEWGAMVVSIALRQNRIPYDRQVGSLI